jgi:2-polyprenyl-6-methoxyphenol hydroxylase-like FAD-dependent oxidoreductase
MGLEIAIAGGGIAGLTAAIALRQRGHEVRLYEKAAAFAEVGGGLSLWPNALAALERLGLEQRVMARGQWEDKGAIRSATGQRLRQVENNNLIITRSALQEVLLAALEDQPVVLGTQCLGVTSPGARPRLRLDRGEPVEADLVIGADGIRSAIRRAIAPDESPPVYSGLCAWRGIALAPGLVDSAWLSVGHGLQFMAAPLPGGQVYWSPLVRLDEGQWEGIESHTEFLRHRFAGWHAPIPRLLELTPEASCLPTPVYFRPPPDWLCRGRVALIGDAAHPMTPDLGQGACQAIEDAVVLAACLPTDAVHLGPALTDFARRRLARIQRVVREGRQLGMVMAARRWPWGGLRNGALRHLPPGLTDRRLASISSREGFAAQLTVGGRPTPPTD